MADIRHGYIFTTEPIAMRAFAAELRHDLPAAGRMVTAALGEELGTPERVRCEAVNRERIDVVIEFPGLVEVGIEGKIDHEVTRDQIERERAVFSDRLILLVKDSDDVNDADQASGPTLAVLTWKDALSHFRDSRITLEDVEAVNDSKRIARRELGAQDMSWVPGGWEIATKDGDGGWPSITVWGPDLPDKRYLMLQIEMTRAALYAATIGIKVTSSDFEPFDAELASAQPPAWIIHADRIGRFLQERLADTTACVSTAAAGAGKKEGGASKMAQARHYGLPLKYAKGYLFDYVGVRTSRVAAADLGPFITAVLSAAVELDGYLRSADDGVSR